MKTKSSFNFTSELRELRIRVRIFKSIRVSVGVLRNIMH